MKIWKYSGLLLIYTGILHIITGLLLRKDFLLDMINNGLADTPEAQYEGQFTFWFLICGIIIIFWGQTLHRYIKKLHKPAPASLGYALLIFSIAGCVLIPFSGFWLFIPQALIIIIANRREKNYSRY